jgi:hypothetical protein
MGFSARDAETVAEILRRAAEAEILPRFRRLGATPCARRRRPKTS